MIESSTAGQESLARHLLVATSSALWSYWPFLALPKEVFDSAEELLNAGWRID